MERVFGEWKKVTRRFGVMASPDFFMALRACNISQALPTHNETTR
jgi:hypothetical protein